MNQNTDSHIEAATNNFAIRCFRDTADKDYILARLAYRSMLTPQFRWSALHCLEKYAKCILLLNRIEGKNIKHEVTSSLKRIANAGKFEVSLCDESAAFIKRLEKGAHHRYLETSYYSLPDDLHGLDLTVWEIRRYCQVLDYEIETSTGLQNLMDLTLDRIKKARLNEEKDTCIMSGWIEKVMKNERHPAREPLLWNNLFFGKSEPRSLKMRVYSESENAPLDMHPEILDEVLKYVYLPKKVINDLRAST